MLGIDCEAVIDLEAGTLGAGLDPSPVEDDGRGVDSNEYRRALCKVSCAKEIYSRMIELIGMA